MKNISQSKYFPVVIGIVLIAISAVFIVTQNRKSVREATQSQSVLDMSIESLKKSIKADPNIVQSYFDLSNAYLQKVRETGDATYYSKISTLLDQAEKIEPENAEIPALRASVSLGRHMFKDAEVFAASAIAKNPARAEYYGLLADAEIELGNYDAAVQVLQKMVDIRPSFSSYSRIAYVRELYGDIEGAQEALRLATSAGSGFKENIAWAYVEQGNLAMHRDLDTAESFYEKALVAYPDYSQAYEGLGKVAFFRGNTEEALEHFKKAFSILPLAQYSTDLADVYAVLGDTQKSKQNLALTQISFESSGDSGVNTDLEEALFLADHNLELSRALSKAEAAYKERPSIYAADYLSWVLYKNGRYAEAAKVGREALRLGEFDAQVLFHQGMIALKNNNTSDAKKYLTKALEINPHFSIQQSSLLKVTLASF